MQQNLADLEIRDIAKFLGISLSRVQFILKRMGPHVSSPGSDPGIALESV
jgi:transposase-like protein